MKKFFTNLCTAPFSALFAVLPTVLLLLLYAWPFAVGYNDVLLPVLQCYDITLPTIPFMHWCVLMAFVSLFRITMSKVNVRSLDPLTKSLRIEAMVNRLAGVATCALVFYVIKWWWL